jgi:hypothetical protein
VGQPGNEPLGHKDTQKEISKKEKNTGSFDLVLSCLRGLSSLVLEEPSDSEIWQARNVREESNLHRPDTSSRNL